MKTQKLRCAVPVALLLVVALMFMTCDLFMDESKEEYTNVWISEDGTMVTLYLDGKGIPMSESGRALNLDMAKMSYDYLEAVFVSSNSIARAAWNIGRAAGISGVDRGATGTGVNYGNTSATLGAGVGNAVLFVGISNDGTLLGIGDVAWVDKPRPASTDLPYVTTTIFPDSTSVTFYVTALKTLLQPDVEDDGKVTNDNTFLTSGTVATSTAAATAAAAIQPNTIARYTNVDGLVNYPIYTISDSAISYGIYEIKGDGTFTSNLDAEGAVMTRLFDAVIVAEGGEAIKRVPRYQYMGRYYTMRQEVVYKTVVTLENNIVPGETFDPKIEFSFDNYTYANKSSGVFAFTFEIPVYAITNEQSDNTSAVDKGYNWTIRSGYGENLYNLDDGVGAGGLVLMGVNITDVSTLDIFAHWRNH